MKMWFYPLLLFSMAIALNTLYFFWLDHFEYHEMWSISENSDIGYNFCTYHSLKKNLDRIEAMGNLMFKKGHFVSVKEINPEQYGEPTIYRDVTDTVGYGVLLGLLWKLTGSFSYLDVQLLQILLFSLLMFLWYQLGLWFFKKPCHAFLWGLSVLLFLPIFYLNVQTNRDVWAYYGSFFLFYLVLRYIHFYKKTLNKTL